jgi:hypothetical protein
MNKAIIGVGSLLVIAGAVVLFNNTTSTNSNVDQQQIESIPSISRDFASLLGQMEPVLNTPTFSEVVTERYGDLDTALPNIENVYWQSFQIDQASADTFKSSTSLEIGLGNYQFVVAKTNRLELSASILGGDEYGLGILPGGNTKAVGTANSLEPIVKFPNQYAIFTQARDGWSEAQILDVQNNFVPVIDNAFTYLSDGNNLVGFLVPESLFGQMPSITFQTFYRDTAIGQTATAEDPSGGFFFMNTRDDNTVFHAPIFADGFESGDVSAWSN